MTRVLTAVLIVCSCLTVSLKATVYSEKSIARIEKSASRTDSFDVLKYHINLDIRNLASKTLKGYTDINIKSKTNGLVAVKLDLLKLSINTITAGSDTLAYTYNDTALNITLKSPLNTGNSITIRVYYQGTPQTDKLWGGFYFSGVYAYNMGVGFDANPHNFGRAWFPCVDEFTSRSLYEFMITTDGTNRALCNGALVNTINNFDGSITWHWQMSSPIPTYLASVAVAPYGVVNDEYNALNGLTPITLAARPNDTTKMKASFINLKKAFEGYEKWYGPHRFERVGFNAVPFTGGAMEHATNIAYPIFAIDGTLSQETLYAHEFAHHWWGDNTTCRTAEDMWLNEGWASYSENLFLEHVYSRRVYDQAVMETHFDVLRWAHLRDGQPWPVSGVPHQYTYGTHVYKKGAGVAHTLRGQLGDAPFMAAVKEFQDSFKFKDVGSEDLKRIMKKHTTGGVNMDDFFEGWVYGVGFPAFSGYLAGTSPATGGGYNCTVKVYQQLRFTQKTYKNVVVDINFIPANYKTTPAHSEKIIINSRDTTVVIKVPFEPILAITDRYNLLADAVTENEFWIKSSNTYNYRHAMVSINVNANAVQDSALMRIEHHWTTPVDGPLPSPTLHASGSRYWRVLGTWTDSLLNATAALQYDGSAPGGLTSGWLDNDLIRTTEDSLVLLYRPDPRTPWQIYPYYQKTMGNTGDKRGNIALQKIKKGEYVFAMYDKTLGIDKPIENQGRLDIYPNPAAGLVKVEFDNIYKTGTLEVTDNTGRKIQNILLYAGQNFVEVDTAGWAAGIYYVSLNGQPAKKLVVE